MTMVLDDELQKPEGLRPLHKDV